MSDDTCSAAVDEEERIEGHQVRQTAWMTIAVVIVLMSALLAFITSPPQPTLLLLGILVAVVIYWVARSTGVSRFQPGVPHEERLAVCAECGFQYCVVCQESCPECGSVHIQPGFR